MLNKIKEKVNRLRERMAEADDLEKADGRYWNLSENDARVQDQSHWVGADRWSHRRWSEYGEFYSGLAVKYIEKYAPADFFQSLSQKAALEWGCGGGAIIRPLCGRFSKVYGVDVSTATLHECKKQMAKMGLCNFTDVFFLSQYPENILQKVGEDSLDFIISVGVFQHFPSKPYTQRVLRVMGKMLKTNAYALLQVRHFDGSPKFRQKDHDYAQNVIWMTSFTVREFTGYLKDAGFSIIERNSDVDDISECHDYYFIKKK
jgi:SAM-dependent methyltransferase